MRKLGTLSLKKKEKRNSILMVVPIVLFTLIFIMGPLIYLIILSFQTRGERGVVLNVFTLNNYARIWRDEVYAKVMINSFGVALLSTFLVSVIGYPFGYLMARLTKDWKIRMNSLIMIPFWVSSLLRLHGWKILLRDGGFFSSLPMWLGFSEAPVIILDSYIAIFFGMVYALTPFMIFSVYSSAEKLDWSLVEASRDLGASRFQAFRTVSFPLTLPGLLSGVILTFIPSMGLIFITELLGGNRILLIGNVIHQAGTVGNDKPFAAALSVVLLVLTTVFITLYRRVFRVEELEGLV